MYRVYVHVHVVSPVAVHCRVLSCCAFLCCVTAFARPLFRRGVVRFDDLKLGTLLTGKVQNVVTFGVFVDVGVGVSGLIHESRIYRHLLRDHTPLGLGDVVEVKVMRLETAPRKKLALELVKVM